MLIMLGSKVLSTFRQNKILEQCAGLTAIQGEYLYLIDVDGDVTDDLLLRLEKLLSAAHEEVLDLDNQLIVVPRLGTVSPWSSKATDIAHRCGLSIVRRIERGIRYQYAFSSDSSFNLSQLRDQLHDPMTEGAFEFFDQLATFAEHKPMPMKTIHLSYEGRHALEQINQNLGLGLSDDELDYLIQSYSSIGRDPNDIELMMFAQANSEHCRHKIFNATWCIDGEDRPETLFGMIRHTYKNYSDGVLSAYRDNGAVLTGYEANRFFVDPESAQYNAVTEPVHIVFKVETHNHPTGIAPFPGAATGAGGEIRDESATGIGGKPKAGLTGFVVSNLRIPSFTQAWETGENRPKSIASPLQIMIDGPIGGAAFNNEFGRPNLGGFFRTFEQCVNSGEIIETRGYHKPLMIAGGIGNIREQHVEKKPLPVKAKVIVLGGPAMLIGLGGGAASSQAVGTGDEGLDFASVQRGNPEMERRAQEVIDSCWALGEKNPILSIHDVGAGGVANAIPELIYQGDRGGKFELRKIPNDDLSMSPLAIWCNESQERYALVVSAEDLYRFDKIAVRECCPYAVVGEITEEQQLILEDSYFSNRPIDIPMSVLLGKPPKMHRDVESRKPVTSEIPSDLKLDEAAERVLRMPAVSSKSFLITIGDRTVGGLVARDQFVGPWQVPVSDCAVTNADYSGYTGEAMAMGECPISALINPRASARLAVSEAVTNLAGCAIGELRNIKLSANWMAACNHPGEDAALYDAVEAVGMELCPDLKLTIPVGKDSLSMKTVWQNDEGRQEVISPLTLVITAVAAVTDTRQTLTPQLQQLDEATGLMLIDLGKGKHRLGGSVLLQAYQEIGNESPDLEKAGLLKNFFDAMQELRSKGLLLAYHDRSDGGLFATVCEMAFAGQVGVTINLDELGEDPVASLFAEELGGVIQVKAGEIDTVREIIKAHQLDSCSHNIGEPNQSGRIEFRLKGEVFLSEERAKWYQAWSETSYHIQRLRDNPDCAKEAFDALVTDDRGLFVDLSFDLNEDISIPYIARGHRPKIAIFREQGVNGHVEMAAAFDRAGFTAVDIHMTDILKGEHDLKDFKGLAACGGFSYGDVLGAGQGWAKSILFNQQAKELLQGFFHREDTFSLGICNGCQMLAALKDIIPGAQNWPTLTRNLSEQFEARLAMVEVVKSHSIFMTDMVGSKIPIVVSHGEGRVDWSDKQVKDSFDQQDIVTLRYIDSSAKVTQSYPANPNGSPEGITGFSSVDGRVMAVMPHPERVFRAIQMSWHPSEWKEDSPWMRIFRNARVWVG